MCHSQRWGLGQYDWDSTPRIGAHVESFWEDWRIRIWRGFLWTAERAWNTSVKDEGRHYRTLAEHDERKYVYNMSSPLFVAISEYQSNFVWVAGSAFKRCYCGAGRVTAELEAEKLSAEVMWFPGASPLPLCQGFLSVKSKSFTTKAMPRVLLLMRIMSTRNGKCTEDMELRAYYFAFQPIFQILLG